jgi:hypothetical protein
MSSSAMWHRVALVRSNVSEESIASIISVERIIKTPYSYSSQCASVVSYN